MKIPLYSNLKAKLESKGLDSITSGQIAWFVCSLLCCVVWDIVAIILNNFDVDLTNIFIGFVLTNTFFNLFYLRNAIVLILSFIATLYVALSHSDYFYFISYSSLGLLILICLFRRKFIINALLILLGYAFAYEFLTLIYSLSR